MTATFNTTTSSTSPSNTPNLTSALFTVALSTVAMNGAAHANPQPVHQRFLNQSDLVSVSEAYASSIDADDTTKKSEASSNSAQFEKAEGPMWMQSCFTRIEKLSNLPKGWGGNNFAQTTEQTAIDTERFLMKLAHAGLRHKPTIGLDDDGSYSLHISEGNLVADLSVHDDGTYSYYAQRGNNEVFSDASSIDGTLDQSLIDILKA